jgi:hypothetical protein
MFAAECDRRRELPELTLRPTDRSTFGADGIYGGIEILPRLGRSGRMTNPLALTSSIGLTQSLSAGTDMLRHVDWSPMKVPGPTSDVCIPQKFPALRNDPRGGVSILRVGRGPRGFADSNRR